MYANSRAFEVKRKGDSCPWKCELELDYPDPVDHKEAREKGRV